MAKRRHRAGIDRAGAAQEEHRLQGRQRDRQMTAGATVERVRDISHRHPCGRRDRDRPIGQIDRMVGEAAHLLRRHLPEPQRIRRRPLDAAARNPLQMLILLESL